MNAAEQEALKRGQLLYDLRNQAGWPLLEEMLNQMDTEVVAEWRSCSPLDTPKVLALHAKANAIREIHTNLLARVNDAIDIAFQIMHSSQS
jgi:hypothetical protein